MEVITSDPFGADIYWGITETDLKRSGHVTTYSGNLSGPRMGNWCYQVKKEGYHDSQIVCMPQTSEDRRVHFDLKSFADKKSLSIIRVTLSWVDQSSNELGFKIERKTGIEGTYREISTVGQNVTSYIDTSVKPAAIYFYRVRAYNSAGYSLYTKEVGFETPAR
jgi:hypothetical protein